MLDELVTAYGNRFLVAALGVSLALLGLFVVLWLLRHRAPSPFVRGGKNRQPRLQVLDAAAIDARRRLVLVRRDNIEHLVMIGGPTDIVIESGIGEDRPYISVQQPAESLPAATRPPAEPVTMTAAPEPRRVAAQTAPTQHMPAPPVEDIRPVTEPLRVERPPVATPIRPVATPVAPPPEVTVSALAEEIQTEKIAPTIAPPSAPPHAESRQAEPQRLPEAEARNPVPQVEDVLDAARQRVLAREVETPPRPLTATASLERASAPAPAESMARPEVPESPAPRSPIAEDELDFEKFLEDEMASHLEGVKASRLEQPAARPAPTVLPPLPAMSPALAGLPASPTAPRQAVPAAPVTAPMAAPPVASPAARPASPSKEEPNLQKEIARIFGEMTAGRND